MTLGEFVDTSEGLFTLIVSVVTICYGVYRGVKWRFKALDKKEKAELEKDSRVATGDGGKAILEVLNAMELQLAGFQKKIIAQGKDISSLNRIIESYKTAVHKLTLLCDVMCPKSDLCKEKINEVLTDLKLTIDEAVN